MKKRVNLVDGEPMIMREEIPYWLGCCDCGKSHVLFYRRLKDKKIEIKFYADEYQTQVNRKTKLFKK